MMIFLAFLNRIRCSDTQIAITNTLVFFQPDAAYASLKLKKKKTPLYFAARELTNLKVYTLIISSASVPKLYRSKNRKNSNRDMASVVAQGQDNEQPMTAAEFEEWLAEADYELVEGIDSEDDDDEMAELQKVCNRGKWFVQNYKPTPDPLEEGVEHRFWYQPSGNMKGSHPADEPIPDYARAIQEEYGAENFLWPPSSHVSLLAAAGADGVPFSRADWVNVVRPTVRARDGRTPETAIKVWNVPSAYKWVDVMWPCSEAQRQRASALQDGTSARPRGVRHISRQTLVSSWAENDGRRYSLCKQVRVRDKRTGAKSYITVPLHTDEITFEVTNAEDADFGRTITVYFDVTHIESCK